MGDVGGHTGYPAGQCINELRLPRFLVHVLCDWIHAWWTFSIFFSVGITILNRILMQSFCIKDADRSLESLLCFQSKKETMKWPRLETWSFIRRRNFTTGERCSEWNVTWELLYTLSSKDFRFQFSARVPGKYVMEKKRLLKYKPMQTSALQMHRNVSNRDQNQNHCIHWEPYTRDFLKLCVEIIIRPFLTSLILIYCMLY
jgi:hypothetical protein